MNSTERLKKFLKKKGLRMTRERSELLSIIMSMGEHFTVTDILETCHGKRKNIGRATIYRTVPVLVSAGILRRAPQCGCHDEQVYEQNHDQQHHDHLICDYCEEIIEFEDSEIEGLQFKIAQKYGYMLKTHFHELRGICSSCQKEIIKEAADM